MLRHRSKTSLGRGRRPPRSSERPKPRSCPQQCPSADLRSSSGGPRRRRLERLHAQDYGSHPAGRPAFWRRGERQIRMSDEACVRLRPGRFMAWVEAGSVPTDLACQRWSFPSQVGGRMLWFVAETKRLLLASRAAAMRSWVTGSSRSVAASKRSERHVPGWGCVFRVAAARVCRRDHGALQYAVAGWSEPWAGPLPGGPRRAGTAESPWVRRPWPHAAGAGTRAMATFRGDSNSETLRTFAFSKRRGRRTALRLAVLGHA